jgi:hypothetical protein
MTITLRREEVAKAIEKYLNEERKVNVTVSPEDISAHYICKDARDEKSLNIFWFEVEVG